ncbi:MAG: peroxidase-related enzyme [Longimicrobiales bacterium]
MAWIRTVDPDAADEELRGVYDGVVSSRGKLSDIMRVQSLAPRAMAAHLDLYLALLFGRSPLTRAEREAIAVTVSVANRCEYCVQHHRAALLAHLRDEDAVRRIVEDFEKAGLDHRLVAMLRYATKLTRSIDEVGESDIDALRERGLTDEEILHVNLITSYFNYVNRIATGLGLTPGAGEVDGYKYG